MDSISYSNASDVLSQSVDGVRVAVANRGDNFGLYAVRNLDYVQFYLVTSTGFTTSALAAFCNFTAVYIILRTQKWSNTWRHRFPLYLAAHDLLWDFCGVVQYGTILTTMRFPERAQCLLEGVSILFLINWHIMLVFATALASYLKVCRGIYVDYGSYDWKYHAFCLSNAAVVTFIGLPFDAFGTASYWCLGNASTVGGRVLIIALGIIFVILASAVVFCYYSVTRRIRDAERKYTRSGRKTKGDMVAVTATGSEQCRRLDWTSKVITKMFAYVLIFTLQWLPAIPVYMVSLWGVDNIWTNFIILLSVHVGGPLNLLLYAKQEGLLCFRAQERKWTDPESPDEEYRLDAAASSVDDSGVGSGRDYSLTSGFYLASLELPPIAATTGGDKLCIDSLILPPEDVVAHKFESSLEQLVITPAK